VSGPPLVEVEGLVKRYGDVTAVDGVDLLVRAGEIVALLGPNGAGKTTTVEIVEGLRRPDAGVVRVLGLDPRRDRAHLAPTLGIMLQSAELPSPLGVREALELFAEASDRPLGVGELLERVGLDHLAERRYRTLSAGERQRLQLALALVGRPRVALLDEPTSSMDAAARRQTWQLLGELRAGGAAVLMTTHLIDEAESLADRVVIIDRGRVVGSGTPADLRRSVRGPDGGAATTGRREVRLELPEALPPDALERLRRLPTAESVRVERPGRYLLTTREPGELLVELSGWLFAAGRVPIAIRLAEATLEEVVLRLTTESAAGDQPAAEDLR
jgi:ABC-2 type transport system ATP-binding protein